MEEPRNTFAEKADQYASARPRYPDSLYAWISSQCVHHEAAWDCASGNGQAAAGLAPHFIKVYATDVSREQIAHSIARQNIEYSSQPAEETRFEDGSFDLIVVAQALHWFDFRRFWPEATRVARPDATFCAWGYDWFTTNIPEVDAELVAPFRALIAPFWAPNNALLWAGYRKEDISFPFELLPTPSLAIELEWRLQQVIEYMMTWSAFKRSASSQDASLALDRLIRQTSSIVSPDRAIEIRMPLKIVAGRIRTRPTP